MIFIFTQCWRSIKVCPLVKLLLALLCLHKKKSVVILAYTEKICTICMVSSELWQKCSTESVFPIMGFFCYQSAKSIDIFAKFSSKSVLCFNFHANSITCNTWFQLLTSALVSFMLLSGNSIFTTCKSVVSTWSLYFALWSVMSY